MPANLVFILKDMLRDSTPVTSIKPCAIFFWADIFTVIVYWGWERSVCHQPHTINHTMCIEVAVKVPEVLRCECIGPPILIYWWMIDLR